MAMKRCPICGEKYSDTYRDCPFCEEDDAYYGGEEIRRAPKRKRRAKHGRQYSLITPMLIVLILIMAGLLIYLLYGDKLMNKQNGDENINTPPIQDTLPEEPSGEQLPDPEQGVMPEDPGTEEDPEPTASDYDLTMALPDGLKLSTTDFSLMSLGATHTIQVSGGSGTYSWVSQDPGIASVDENGKVTAVSGGTVNVVATDGNKKGVCIVRIRATGTLQPSPSTPTTPSTGDSSGLKAGDGKVVNGGNGVRVRSGPSTDHSILATIPNGASIKIIRSAGDGWYEITFAGVGGVTTSGYMKGDFLANK